MAFLETDTLGQERFSLLLLDPGEIYFEDFSVYYYPNGVSVLQAIDRKQRGHLKLCSKSVVFVPKDIQYPILKFPLKFVEVIDEDSQGLLSKVGKLIKITTTQTVEMKEKNIIAPFVFRKEERVHYFSLNYAAIDDCLPQICQLHRASTLPPGDQSAMLNAIILSRQSRVKFNTSWLEDIYERIILEMRGDRVTPLVNNPGRIMLTSSRLYFQPLNNIDKWPVLKIRLKDIQRLICRRFLLRQLGLEIYCGGSAPVSHLYLAFKTKELRNELYEQILNLPGKGEPILDNLRTAVLDLNLEDTGQEDMTLKWQSGNISNYDYLLYLNSLADRSFNDLSQYPVMPWVIKDYSSQSIDLQDESVYRDLSKPIGALNPDRLERIKERLPDIPEPKFLYGSHYSTPGYVLFYLARIAPEYVLCLQNGKFDHPDRMFNNLLDTWTNVLRGASDFKELIPEFYSTSGDFLTHRGVISFGFRNDGRPVADVELPPWASSPSEFNSILREALESDIVSRSIHRWIDLIFGYQQHGEEAEQADNVFYYLTYEGAIDLDSITDEAERKSLETQIMEFGQTPKQLFTSPHPQRFTSQSIPRIISQSSIPQPIETSCVSDLTEIENAVEDAVETSKSDAAESTDLNLSKLSCHMQYTLHKDAVTQVRLSLDSFSIFSVSQGKQTVMCRLTVDQISHLWPLQALAQVGLDLDRPAFTIWCASQLSLVAEGFKFSALSSCEVMDDKTIVVGSWDNKVYFYSIEYGRVLDTLNGHDDAVSCVRWKCNKLFTASWDSTVKIWEMNTSASRNNLGSPEFLEQLDHDEGVTCMDMDSDCVVMVTGTKDGYLTLWDLVSFYALSSVSAHGDSAIACVLSADKRRIFSCGVDNLLKVIDVETMTEIFTKDLTHQICCMNRWGSGSLLLTGDAGGNLSVWDMDMGQVTQTFKAHKGAVTCMDGSHKGTLLTGGGDRAVILWKMEL